MVKSINTKMKTAKNRKGNERERKARGKGRGEANVNA